LNEVKLRLYLRMNAQSLIILAISTARLQAKYNSSSHPVKLAAIPFSKQASVNEVMVSPHRLIQADDHEPQQDGTVSVFIHPPSGERDDSPQKRSPNPIKDQLPIRPVLPFELAVAGEVLQVSDVVGGELVLSGAVDEELLFSILSLVVSVHRMLPSATYHVSSTRYAARPLRPLCLQSVRRKRLACGTPFLAQLIRLHLDDVIHNTAAFGDKKTVKVRRRQVMGNTAERGDLHAGVAVVNEMKLSGSAFRELLDARIARLGVGNAKNVERDVVCWDRHGLGG
jgi:hypothetical protein